MRKCGVWQLVQIITFALCICVSSLLLAANASDMLDHLPIPEDTTVTIVSDHTIHNGIEMAMAAFSSHLDIDKVLSYYREQWSDVRKESQPGFMESSTPGWLLISRLQDEHQVVIQLSTEQTTGSSGFVSIMPLHAPRQSRHVDIFSSLSLLSTNSSQDRADHSIMRVFASSTSVSATHVRYRDELVGLGWRLLMDAAVDDGRIMIMSRDQKRLELSFLASPEYASVLVAHEVESK